MTPRLESVEYVGQYKIRVRFADGIEGDIDLQDELWGEVFEPLKDLRVFRRVELNRELNTVTWPTGADLAPEFLYEKAAEQSPTAARG
jgi:hypothetical protein